MVLMILFSATEMQTYRTDWWTKSGKERVGEIETVACKHIDYHIQWKFAI